jgi:hypothetical protein
MFCLHFWLARSSRPTAAASTVFISICIHVNCRVACTVQRKLGALLEKAEALGAGARADEATQGTRKKTIVNSGAVTRVRRLVAARQLGLVATLVLGLLDRHVMGDMEANIAVALVANTITGPDATSPRSWGESSHGGSESQDGGSKLHCGFGVVGFEREYQARMPLQKLRKLHCEKES